MVHADVGSTLIVLSFFFFCLVLVYWTYIVEKYSHRHWRRGHRGWILSTINAHIFLLLITQNQISQEREMESRMGAILVKLWVKAFFSFTRVWFQEKLNGWNSTRAGLTLEIQRLLCPHLYRDLSTSQHPGSTGCTWWMQLFSAESVGSLQDEGLQTLDVITSMKISVFLWSFQVWKVKPMPRCPKPALFVINRRQGSRLTFFTWSTVAFT